MVLLRSDQTSAQTALSENYYYVIIKNAMDISEPYWLQKDFSFANETYCNILNRPIERFYECLLLKPVYILEFLLSLVQLL